MSKTPRTIVFINNVRTVQLIAELQIWLQLTYALLENLNGAPVCWTEKCTYCRCVAPKNCTCPHVLLREPALGSAHCSRGASSLCRKSCHPCSVGCRRYGLLSAAIAVSKVLNSLLPSARQPALT